MKMTPRRLRLSLNLFPPLLGAGVRVTHIARDWRELHVEMKLRWYNRNFVGTHFGGSLYTMVDPHLMLMLMQLLGRDYVVWDQAADIRFEKPGRGRVHAIFRIDEAVTDEIRARTADGEAYRPEFTVRVLDDDGATVATIRKTLYVRRKRGR